MSPLTVEGCVELAALDRNGLIESRHIGAFVVIDRDGSVIESGGDIDATIFPRSTIKPFQAIATLRAGAELAGVSGADAG